MTGDVDGLGDQEVIDGLLAALEHRDRVQAWVLAAVAEFDRRALWLVDGVGNPTRWLAARAPLATGDARRMVTRAHHLAAASQVAAAVAEGRLSVGQADALAALRVSRLASIFDRDQDVLVEAAVGLSVDDTQDLAQAWLQQADEDGPVPGDDDQRARFSRTLDGRGRLDADLGPNGALILGSTLDRIMDDLWRRANSAGDPVQPAARRRADALVEMARRASAAGDATAARPLFIVRCDLTDLFNRAGWQAGRPATAGLFDELAGDPDRSAGPGGSREPGRTAPLSGAGGSAGAAAAGTAGGWDTSDRRERRAAAQFGPEALWDWRAYGRPTTDTGHPVDPYFFRELLCDADLVRVICDGPSQILDVGRAERTVTGPQRHALSVRDGGCIYPGCDRPPGWCHAHHIKHWENDGLTDLDNLCLLCNFHHRQKHRGRFEVIRQPDGTFVFIRPDGSVIEPPARLVTAD